MDFDETKGWTIFGFTLIVCIAILIHSAITNGAKTDQAALETVNKAIEAGVDPMTAKCAAGFDTTEEEVCLVVAAKLKGKDQ